MYELIKKWTQVRRQNFFQSNLTLLKNFYLWINQEANHKLGAKIPPNGSDGLVNVNLAAPLGAKTFCKSK